MTDRQKIACSADHSAEVNTPNMSIQPPVANDKGAVTKEPMMAAQNMVTIGSAFGGVKRAM